MEITLLPSLIAVQSAPPFQYLTSFLINETLAIDAGSLGIHGLPDQQRRVRHVLLSHTHLDHLATLPLFLENTRDGRTEPVGIYACQGVLDCLARDFFNDRVWPDLSKLRRRGFCSVEMFAIEPGSPLELDGVRITPVAMEHVVPTVGFILEEAETAAVICSDTAPTEEVWQRTARLPRLEGVFLEATYPNEMIELAALAKHLTPALLAGELEKLGRPVRTFVTHIRIRFYDQVVHQLKALNLPGLEIVEPGKVYRLGGKAPSLGRE